MDPGGGDLKKWETWKTLENVYRSPMSPKQIHLFSPLLLLSSRNLGTYAPYTGEDDGRVETSFSFRVTVISW